MDEEKYTLAVMASCKDLGIKAKLLEASNYIQTHVLVIADKYCIVLNKPGLNIGYDFHKLAHSDNNDLPVLTVIGSTIRIERDIKTAEVLPYELRYLGLI